MGSNARVMKLSLVGLAAVVSIKSMAQPAGGSEHPQTACEAALIQMLIATAPSASETHKYKSERAQLQKKVVPTNGLVSGDPRKETLASFTYIQGMQIYEKLLRALDENRSDYDISMELRFYVDPMVDQTRKLMSLAKQIHQAIQTNERESVAVQNLINQYKAESVKFGEGYSRYVMIMDTLESVANNQGVLGVSSQKRDTIIGNNLQIDRDLRRANVVSLAQRVLERLNGAEMTKFFPNEIITQENGIALPQPSLKIVKEIYERNVYANIANLKWRLAQEQAASNIATYAFQTFSEGVQSSINKLPALIQPLARTMVGIGVTDARATRYMKRALDMIKITRYADPSTGNLVISTDTSYVDKQITALFEDAAYSLDDDYLDFLFQVPYFRLELDQIIAALETQSGRRFSDIDRDVAPNPPAKPTPPANPGPVVKPMAAVAAADGAQEDIDAEKQAGGDPAADNNRVTPPSTTTVQTNSGSKMNSVSATAMLGRLKRAYLRAEKLPPISFEAPRPYRMMARLALTQAINITSVTLAYQYWPQIQHVAAPVLQYIGSLPLK